MIVKIAIIAVIFALIILYLKSINPELALLASVCASVLIISLVIDMLGDVFNLYERLSSISSINITYIKIIIKVTIIAYVVEFSAGIIEEFGMKSLADKLVFVGKIVIVLLAVPIIESVVDVIEGLL